MRRWTEHRRLSGRSSSRGPPRISADVRHRPQAWRRETLAITRTPNRDVGSGSGFAFARPVLSRLDRGSGEASLVRGPLALDAHLEKRSQKKMNEHNIGPILYRMSSVIDRDS